MLHTLRVHPLREREREASGRVCTIISVEFRTFRILFRIAVSMLTSNSDPGKIYSLTISLNLTNNSCASMVAASATYLSTCPRRVTQGRAREETKYRDVVHGGELLREAQTIASPKHSRSHRMLGVPWLPLQRHEADAGDSMPFAMSATSPCSRCALKGWDAWRPQPHLAFPPRETRSTSRFGAIPTAQTRPCVLRATHRQTRAECTPCWLVSGLPPTYQA